MRVKLKISDYEHLMALLAANNDVPAELIRKGTYKVKGFTMNEFDLAILTLRIGGPNFWHGG